MFSKNSTGSAIPVGALGLGIIMIAIIATAFGVYTYRKYSNLKGIK